MDKSDEKDEQLVFFSYIDKETGKILAQDQVAGRTGELIEYQPDKQLTMLGKRGYILAYNGFPEGSRYSENDQMNQVFAILLQHKRRTITPNEKGVPADNSRYAHSYTLTVNFVDEEGNEVYPAAKQQAVWQCPFILDEVTGSTVAQENAKWVPDKAKYKAIKAPVVPGYLAGMSMLPAQPVAQQNLSSTIVYHSLGKIIPITDGGQVIPGAKPKRYQNDPDNASKIAVQEIPKIVGYKTNMQTLTPADPLKDVKVHYEAELF